jgi:hypothetical protein
MALPSTLEAVLPEESRAMSMSIKSKVVALDRHLGGALIFPLLGIRRTYTAVEAWLLTVVTVNPFAGTVDVANEILVSSRLRVFLSNRLATWLTAGRLRRLLSVSMPISALAFSVILAVVIQIYAGIALRGVYSDGAYYATRLAAHQSILHPGRVMCNLIVEWLVAAAMHLGVQTPHSVALVFSIVTNVLPGLIILLCLPALPAGERHFFILPAFVYFAGTLSAQFASVAEGLVATSYFWLLLFLIAFGRLTNLRLALIALLSVGTLDLHEQMSFLGPILIASCAIRWWQEPRLLPRVVLSVAALCAVASTVIATNYVLHPLSVDDRNGFIASFPAFEWLYLPGGWNLPCVLGMLAVFCILLTTVRPAWGVPTTWIFSASSILLALAAFWIDWLTVPNTQYAARYNGALMSVLLAALLLYMRMRPQLVTAMTTRPVRAIVVTLGLTVSLWHLSATEQWSVFLTNFSNILQSRDGIIAGDTVFAPHGSRQAELAAKMFWSWTYPDLSLVALPRSCINSVISTPSWSVGWEPHTLSNLATMPAIPGVIYTYLLPPDQRRAVCPAE